MKKGDLHTVQITAYTSEGAGVARIDGMAVFVPQAIRGETCEIMILKVEKSFAFAKLFLFIYTLPFEKEEQSEKE